MVNVVVLAGNTTRDFETRRTQSGMAVTSFGIAVNDRRKNPRSGEYENVPNFFDVVGFGDRWEKIAGYVPKGTKVTVSGKLRWSQWDDKNGNGKRSKVEVVAEEIELPPRGSDGGARQQQRREEPEPVEATYIDGGVYDDEIPFD
jgi:single-strand DNA-binding protein